MTTQDRIKRYLQSGRSLTTLQAQDRSYMGELITCKICGKQIKAGGKGAHIRSHKLNKKQENEILKDRLLDTVFYSPDGCWYWTGAVNGTMGYGMMIHKLHGQIATHRLSYQLFKGKIPKGKWVLHTCDNPKCINPDHLFIGDRAINVKDMHNKGRAKVICRGENHIDAKLTTDQVIDIRRRMANGETRANLAREFGVKWICMHYIYTRKNWKYV